jgi:hypothetical protein
MFVVEKQEIKSPVYLHSCARLSSRLSFPHRLHRLPTYSDPFIGSRQNIDTIALSKTSPENIAPFKNHRSSSYFIARHRSLSPFVTYHYKSPLLSFSLQVVGGTLEGTFAPLALSGSY